MTRYTLDRRTFIETTAALGTTVLLAGCAGGGDGGDEFLADEPNYDGWLDDVENYEGTVDRTDADEARVDVGSEGGLAFTPPAVAVSPGTTVVWEWTGEGGDHDVTAEDGPFQSDQSADEGHTFEHTFEESGTFRYVCTPHEAVGMKGVVYVE
ncbi:halocyanin domain-containing protein [Halorubrum sp. DTA98]|uniref:halocyanin domain-containing protein n=1 Tax=Halorubrum sp. DTA98 TaxID=3402163 RepID=UPI003AAAC1CD